MPSSNVATNRIVVHVGRPYARCRQHWNSFVFVDASSVGQLVQASLSACMLQRCESSCAASNWRCGLKTCGQKVTCQAFEDSVYNGDVSGRCRRRLCLGSDDLSRYTNIGTQAAISVAYVRPQYVAIFSENLWSHNVYATDCSQWTAQHSHLPVAHAGSSFSKESCCTAAASGSSLFSKKIPHLVEPNCGILVKRTVDVIVHLFLTVERR